MALTRHWQRSQSSPLSQRKQPLHANRIHNKNAIQNRAKGNRKRNKSVSGATDTMIYPKITAKLNPQQERLVFRLMEGELSLNRFLKVGSGKLIDGKYLDKAAFETDFQNHLYDPNAFESWPRWGIIGKEYLVLLDFDKQEIYDIMKERLPETFEVTSPRRGLPHRYYIVCGKQVPNLKFHVPGDTYVNAKGATVKNPSGEIRADNHYLVAPGTTIRYEENGAWKSGEYTITNDVPIARLEYEDFMKAINGYLMEAAGERILTDEKLFYGVSVGERHDTIFRYACRLIGDNPEGGFPANVALEMLERYNNTKLFDEHGNLAPVEKPFLKRVILEALEKAAKNSDYSQEQIAKYGFNTLREGIITSIKEKPKKLPTYADFVAKDEKGKWLEEFKPAKVAQWIYDNLNFKTDLSNEILYCYDYEKKCWVPEADEYLHQITTKILGEYDRQSHFKNILHSLRGLTLTEITFSAKISLPNGLFDPETQELTEHTPDEMPLFSIPTEYTPNSPYPKWQKWLDDVLPNKEDQALLQEWSGYILLPDYRFHKMLFNYGNGRNGKGTWERTIQAVIGKHNCSEVALEELNGFHRFSLKDLYGKLVNFCSEPSTKYILQTSLLKKLTGQDIISAELKGANKRLEYTNTAKITVSANGFPTVEDKSIAFKERRLFLHWTKEYLDENKNQIQWIERTWLQGKENEKKGILFWMVEGLKRLLDQGHFTQGKTQKETEILFQRASDTIRAFIEEMFVWDKNRVTTRSEAYEGYKEYCEIFGLESENERKFTQTIKETPKITATTTSKPKRERAWKGFSLKCLNDDETVTDVTDVTLLQHWNISNPKIREVTEPVTSVTCVTQALEKSALEEIHYCRIPPNEPHKCQCPSCSGEGVREADFETVDSEGKPLFVCEGCLKALEPKVKASGMVLVEDLPDYPEEAS